VEEVAAEGDAYGGRAGGGAHGLVADGADVVVLGQLLLGGRGQGVDVFGGLPTAQIGEPARLKALPHVEVAVDDQDGRVGPGPLADQRFVEAGADDEDGHQELEAAGHGAGVVDDVVQALPRLVLRRVVQEQRVDDQQPHNLLVVGCWLLVVGCWLLVVDTISFI